MRLCNGQIRLVCGLVSFVDDEPVPGLINRDDEFADTLIKREESADQ